MLLRELHVGMKANLLFPGEASRKLHAVTRHMGWTLNKLTVVNA